MRLLLLSDTHGELGIINELATEVRADAVIHAGDFGFYDEGSYERISDRELRLHITHSDLEAEFKKEILGLSHDERIAACRDACPLSELPMFIEGRLRFEVPDAPIVFGHNRTSNRPRFSGTSADVDQRRRQVL